jgi:hypothetical protein
MIGQAAGALWRRARSRPACRWPPLWGAAAVAPARLVTRLVSTRKFSEHLRVLRWHT